MSAEATILSFPRGERLTPEYFEVVGAMGRIVSDGVEAQASARDIHEHMVVCFWGSYAGLSDAERYKLRDSCYRFDREAGLSLKDDGQFVYRALAEPILNEYKEEE